MFCSGAFQETLWRSELFLKEKEKKSNHKTTYTQKPKPLFFNKKNIHFSFIVMLKTVSYLYSGR